LKLTPKTRVASGPRISPDRSKTDRCDEVSLGCGWLRLSARVKEAFGSGPLH
jgi:hypothetical protein